MKEKTFEKLVRRVKANVQLRLRRKREKRALRDKKYNQLNK